jgi:hypothetical protein
MNSGFSRFRTTAPIHNRANLPGYNRTGSFQGKRVGVPFVPEKRKNTLFVKIACFSQDFLGISPEPESSQNADTAVKCVVLTALGTVGGLERC